MERGSGKAVRLQKSRPHSQDLGPRSGNILETPHPPTEAPYTVARDKPVSKDKNPPSER